jgi:hypothetical protein
LQGTHTLRVVSVPPTASVPLTFDVTHYRRGLVKIVYELACVWLGDSYLDDPTAEKLRALMLDVDLPFDVSSKYTINGTIRFAARPLLLPFWEHERTNLISFAMAQNGAIAVYVSVLGALEAMVQVTANAAAYPSFQSHFVSIDPVTGATRSTSFEEEVMRIGDWSADRDD